MIQKFINFFKDVLERGYTISGKLFHFRDEGIPFPGSIIYSYILKKFGLYYSILKKISQDPYITKIQGSILDIGTGPAYLPIKIAEGNSSCRVIGLDISSSMIRIAAQEVRKAKLSNRISLKLGTVAKIPFSDQTFDFIISTGSIHHWKNPVQAFNEIFRVLKRSGKAWIYDVFNPIPRDRFNQLCSQYGRLVVTLFFLHSFTESFYNEQNFHRILQKSAFKKGTVELFDIFYKIKVQKS